MAAATLMETLEKVWHWLTTSRYTRLLEERVARLETENAHLRNSIYVRAGVGPLPVEPGPGAAGGAERKTPQPIRRPVSWAQVKQKLESAAASGMRRDEESGRANAARHGVPLTRPSAEHSKDAVNGGEHV
jgi:hypothetical protein